MLCRKLYCLKSFSKNLTSIMCIAIKKVSSMQRADYILSETHTKALLSKRHHFLPVIRVVRQL